MSSTQKWRENSCIGCYNFDGFIMRLKNKIGCGVWKEEFDEQLCMLTMFNIRNNRHFGLRKMDNSSRKAKLLYILAIAYGLVHYFIVFAFTTIVSSNIWFICCRNQTFVGIYFLVLYIIAVVTDQTYFWKRTTAVIRY